MCIAALRSLIVALCLPIVAFAQNAQQPPASVAEALAVCQKVVDEEKAKLAAAQAEHDAAVAAAEEQLIANLKVLAKEAVAGGDLPEAAKRWEEVLKVDAKDDEAVKFFETIKRGDVVRKYAAAGRGRSEARVEFRTQSGRIFKKDHGNAWSDSLPNHGPYRELSRDGICVLIESAHTYHLFFDDQFLWKRKGDAEKWKAGELGAWAKQ